MSVDDLPRVLDPARLAAVRATKLLDTDPESAYDELASLAARLLRAPFAFITLVDDERSFWKARIGIPPDGPVQNLVEESFCQYVIATGKPLIADDVTRNEVTANNPSIASMGVQAWAGFPLSSPEGHSLGSFCVVDTVVREWTDEDVEVLRVLSSAASRELALRTTVRQATAANDQLAVMARVSQSLTETLDVDEAVARLARLVVPLLGQWSLVSLVDDHGNLADVGWWHAREELAATLERFAGARLIGLAGEGATIDAQRSRRPVVLESGALETGLRVLVSEQAREAYRELNPDSYGVWPLVSNNIVHGVLVIARDLGRPSFTAGEIELAQSIALRAGTVLDNARLYADQQAASEQLALLNVRLAEASRHDRIVSRALQEAMLTQLPQPDHLQVSARYLPAESDEQVGGDWFDALLPPSGATTLMIGDVAGHDIAAATVMGQLRNILRTLAWEHADETPSQIITRLDLAMSEFGMRTMTSLIVARIEQSDADAGAGLRRVRWSSAGHPAPVLISADGTPRLLETRADPPLAVIPDAVRHDHVAEIGPGETLLMYSDGLIETRADDLADRQAQLLDVLAGCREQLLEDVLDTVLVDMVGSQPKDDVALIAVRFHPEDEPRPREAGPTNIVGPPS